MKKAIRQDIDNLGQIIAAAKKQLADPSIDPAVTPKIRVSIAVHSPAAKPFHSRIMDAHVAERIIRGELLKKGYTDADMSRESAVFDNAAEEKIEVEIIPAKSPSQ